MMHRLRRYDVFRFAQNDVAPDGRNDAMFAQCAVRHTSFAQRTSLGEAVIICRRQTSFKKRTFVGRQKCVFCCLKRVKRSKIKVKANKRSILFHYLCNKRNDQFRNYYNYENQNSCENRHCCNLYDCFYDGILYKIKPV